MSSRHKSRARALQMLYQMEHAQVSIDDAIANFGKDFEFETGAREYTEALIRGISNEKDTLDNLIENAAENWTLERIAIIDRNILRLAIYEILHVDTVPAAVAIDEALELAKEFAADTSVKFINGVLDHIQQNTRQNLAS